MLKVPPVCASKDTLCEAKKSDIVVALSILNAVMYKVPCMSTIKFPVAPIEKVLI